MPRISNTNGRRMVALNLTPREQRGSNEMHDNFSPIDPPPESSWLDATGGHFGGWGCRGNSSDGADRVRRHPQPPQLSLPVRCLVSDATALPTVGPIAGYLPEASADSREGRNSGSNQKGEKSISGRAVRTLGCSRPRPSTGRVPTTPENGLLGSTR